jgi:uncharacterized membrane protein
MSLLIAGVILFGLPHLLSIVAPSITGSLKSRLGEKPYKGLYALASLAGVVLMGWGYVRTRDSADVLYAPWDSGRHVLLLVILVAFVLIFSNQSKGYVARLVHHPFSIGVVLWSIAHLLANGEAPVVWIFATTLVIGLADVVFGLTRGKRATHEPRLAHDLRGIAVGAGLYLLFAFAIHPHVFGVPVIR